jgi:hypothetical protein
MGGGFGGDYGGYGQSPFMGGMRGGFDDSGMGGYMQQMAMNKYAMRPQFQPQPDLTGQTPQQAQYLANEGYRSIPAAPRAPMTQKDYQNAQNRMGQLFGMPTSAFSQFASNAQARQPQTLNDMYGNMATLPLGYARDSSGNVVFSDAGISLPPGLMLAKGGIASLIKK